MCLLVNKDYCSITKNKFESASFLRSAATTLNFLRSIIRFYFFFRMFRFFTIVTKNLTLSFYRTHFNFAFVVNTFPLGHSVMIVKKQRKIYVSVILFYVNLLHTTYFSHRRSLDPIPSRSYQNLLYALHWKRWEGSISRSKVFDDEDLMHE